MTDINKAGKIKILGDSTDRISENTKRLLAGEDVSVGNVAKGLSKEYADILDKYSLMTEEEKNNLYANAIAYLYPQIEDFGITAVEAMAAGKPVIAYCKGGAAETVIPGMSGAHLANQRVEDIIDAVTRFSPQKYDAARIRTHAEKFSKERFVREFTSFLQTHLS